MTPRNRNRIGLILILLLFAAPLLTAYVLNTLGWRPAGTRNYGTLIEPPQDLTQARFILADGKALEWKDAEWSWTIFALTGPGCAAKCMARIDELRRARLTLNQNAYRALKPVEVARDPDAVLAGLHPSASDDVVAAFADPHGFLVLRYPDGYNGNLLRKDLARLIKP
jgi:cytochrome oxidase Cu insertion factor (SCO1/SenC/PrrC family)